MIVGQAPDHHSHLNRYHSGPSPFSRLEGQRRRRAEPAKERAREVVVTLREERQVVAQTRQSVACGRGQNWPSLAADSESPERVLVKARC